MRADDSFRSAGQRQEHVCARSCGRAYGRGEHGWYPSHARRRWERAGIILSERALRQSAYRTRCGQMYRMMCARLLASGFDVIADAQNLGRDSQEGLIAACAHMWMMSEWWCSIRRCACCSTVIAGAMGATACRIVHPRPVRALGTYAEGRGCGMGESARHQDRGWSLDGLR